MPDTTYLPSQQERNALTSRRNILKFGAWSTPVLAVAVAAPLAAASRHYAIESNFGSGWYPTTQGQTSNGVYQYDSHSADKYLRVTGTNPGDILSGIYIRVLISTGWPTMTLTAVPGSNPAWSALSLTGETETVGAVTYNVYRSDFSGTVVATSPATTIPIGFYFRTPSSFYSGQTYQSRRYVTVNGTQVELIRETAAIVNTNETSPPSP